MCSDITVYFLFAKQQQKSQARLQSSLIQTSSCPFLPVSSGLLFQTHSSALLGWEQLLEVAALPPLPSRKGFAMALTSTSLQGIELDSNNCPDFQIPVLVPGCCFYWGFCFKVLIYIHKNTAKVLS